AELIQLVDLFLERLDGRLADQGMKVEVSDAAKNLLAERGYDPVLGARPMRRTIQLEVEDTLSEKILFKEIGRGQTIKVDVEGECREAEFIFEGSETENFSHDDVEVANELAAAGSNGSSDSSLRATEAAESMFEGIETENFSHDDDDVENELAAAGSNGSSESSV